MAVLVGAYFGAYGPLVTCGADGAAVCVGWPGVVSGAIWVLFVALFVGLGVWQVRIGRRLLDSPNAVASDEDS